MCRFVPPCQPCSESSLSNGELRLMSMASSFDLSSSRADRYDQLDMQCPALLTDGDVVANQANFAAIVHAAFGWHWVGFYRVLDQELVLGPFQGPVACTRLPKGKGVCAEAWSSNAAVVVPDVHAFSGHIACSPLSQSELVLPVRDAAGAVRAVFDVDSAIPDDFEAEDAARMQRLLDANAHRLISVSHEE